MTSESLGTRGMSGIASGLHTYSVCAKCRTRFGRRETKNPLTIGRIPMELRRTFNRFRPRHGCLTLHVEGSSSYPGVTARPSVPEIFTEILHFNYRSPDPAPRALPSCINK